MAPVPAKKTGLKKPTTATPKIDIISSSAKSAQISASKVSGTKLVIKGHAGVKVPASKAPTPDGHIIGSSYTDDQALCFYLVSKKKYKDVDDYLMVLGMKVDGKELAGSLKDWADSGWGSPIWNALIKGKAARALDPHEHKLRSFEAHEVVRRDLEKLGAILQWFGATDVRAEFKGIVASAARHPPATSTQTQSPPSIQEMAQMAKVFGWDEGESVGLALRLIRGSSVTSSYAKRVSDLSHVREFSGRLLGDVKSRHGGTGPTKAWPYGEKFDGGAEDEQAAAARSAGFFADIRG